MPAAELRARVRTTSVAGTIALGERLGRAAEPGDLVCLWGDLGAGKTQLAKGIAVPVVAGQNPFSTPGTQDGEVQAHLDEMGNALRMNNAAAVRAFGEHIAQHEQVWLASSPFQCAFLGIPPPPQQSMGMPGEAGAQAPAGGPQKAQGGKSAPSEREPAPQEQGGPSGGLGVPLPKPAQPPAQANVTH